MLESVVTYLDTKWTLWRQVNEVHCHDFGPNSGEFSLGIKTTREFCKEKNTTFTYRKMIENRWTLNNEALISFVLFLVPALLR